MTQSIEERLAKVEDRLAITDVMSNYATGFDARDWDLWRSVFTDEVIFDLSSWNSIEPKPLETDRLVRVQARIFAEFKTTQHFFTNLRIMVDGDRARMFAHMRAEHWIESAESDAGIERYTMFGYYDNKFVRTAEGWKMSELQLNVTHTQGNRWVMEEAERRARKKREAEGR